MNPISIQPRKFVFTRWHDLSEKMNSSMRDAGFFIILLGVIGNSWAICDVEFNSAMEANLKLSDGGYSGSIRRNQQDWSSGKRLPSGADEERSLLEHIAGHERNRNEAVRQKKPREVLEITGKIKLNEHTLCWLRNQHRSEGRSATNSSLDAIATNPDQSTQQAQQAQQAALQNQARADQQRQGKRKTNDPAAQAHECIAIDQAGSGNFGAFKNTCGYKVNFTTCNYRPRTIQGGFNWSASFDCEKQQLGLHTPDAGSSVAAHNRNTEMVYWFACRAPATPVDAAFVVGKGIEARCHN